MNIRQKERIFFFFTHAITILSLFTYSVCDEKVKKIGNKLLPYFQRKSTNTPFCVVFSMKKPFSSHKIGRFLGKNCVKNMFFFLMSIYQKTMKIDIFHKWLNHVERIRQNLEKSG